MTRNDVIAEARTWTGTPFHHGARIKGVGVDCAQFLIAVYSVVGLVQNFQPGYYARDWFLHQGHDVFREWVRQFCRPTEAPHPGDVAMFRYGRVASHGAIVLEWGERGRVIHSYRGRGVLEEECRPMSPLWSRFDSCWTFDAFEIPR